MIWHIPQAAVENILVIMLAGVVNFFFGIIAFILLRLGFDSFFDDDWIPTVVFGVCGWGLVAFLAFIDLSWLGVIVIS